MINLYKAGRRVVKIAGDIKAIHAGYQASSGIVNEVSSLRTLLFDQDGNASLLFIPAMLFPDERGHPMLPLNAFVGVARASHQALPSTKVSVLIYATLGASRVSFPSVAIPREGTMTGPQYRGLLLSIFNKQRDAAELPALTPKELAIGPIESLPSTILDERYPGVPLPTVKFTLRAAFPVICFVMPGLLLQQNFIVAPNLHGFTCCFRLPTLAEREGFGLTVDFCPLT
ncbi:uncharacterized protein N7473_009721 [Penicillium subrubescens]|uniref:Uncharacterized protein n=1 Tax=Penicillium subrubescens TaxID=1316194 RepID=A0A1Q5THH3_9EURO|nr:uncharacterized protein N7473_009721 [Penicillium subrubescens]KAJ5887047.1 hypothetical protein N7473_009721 [Penicillium subrubescens]OKO99683.1 hypothetical protein PENSUB_8336 [Penicillium subrubescens]